MDVGNELKYENVEGFQVIINDHQVFHPGEKLTGAVQLTATKVLYVTRLFVKICGQAYVKWTKLAQLKTTEFANCENYLNDSKVLLDVTVNSDDFETLLPGNNQFPFSFVIPPSHLPSSFYHGWRINDYAAIRYWVIATMCLSNNEELTATQTFYLKETADLTEESYLYDPKTVSAEEYITWCCFKTGPIVTKLEINHSAYHPGDDILFTVIINNVRNLLKAGKVEVQLMHRINFIANSDYTYGLTATSNQSFEREHWSIEKNVLLSTSVASRRKICWENVRLKIPKAILPTISNSKCIQLSYFVRLTISSDSIIRIPIIIFCKPRKKSIKKIETESGDEDKNI